jgi:peptidoglycan hydrolase-like protein with peptidoglycan-binding domain
MRDIIAPVMAALAVLYVLIVLVLADQTSTGPVLVKGQEQISDLGSRLIQTVMLQRRRQESQDQGTNANQTMKIQQALKENGFYAGPIDGVMRKRTQEAIRSFQRSRDLKATGRIDNETARALRVRWVPERSN